MSPCLLELFKNASRPSRVGVGLPERGVCKRVTSGKHPCWISLRNALMRCREGLGEEEPVRDISITYPHVFFFLIASNKGACLACPRGYAKLAMAELLSSLHDRSLLLSDRVKVASYLWRQNELLANGFLLNWSCQELCLAYSKKNKSPPPHVTTGNLWALLGVIVKAVVEDGSVMALPALNSYLFQVKYLSMLTMQFLRWVGLVSPYREWVWCFLLLL